ncbi:MAG: DedA family protein [Bacilli bacterium]|nr:DedA family protein [Bacilli bacterium]
MENFVIGIMNKFGYLGIFLLILLENLFPPIPSEVILTFGGFMTISTSMNVFGVILVSTIGSLLGAIILYYLGKILNKERINKIIKSKYGKLLRIKSKDIEMADKWFDTKGRKTVFFCRFIPVVRSLISIPAGMSEMPLPQFTIYTFFGSLIWNTVLILIGAFAGDKKDYILSLLDDVSNIVLIALIVIFVVLIYKFYNTRIKKKSN